MGPWRKQSYMQAKWLKSCERNTSTRSLSVGDSGRLPKPRASMLTVDLLENFSDVRCTAVEVVWTLLSKITKNFVLFFSSNSVWFNHEMLTTQTCLSFIQIDLNLKLNQYLNAKWSELKTVWTSNLKWFEPYVFKIRNNPNM